MLDHIVIETADLKWIVPMVIGAGALLGCIVAVIRNKVSWTVTAIAVLSASLIGASVFNKISLTREGLIVETASLSVENLEKLQEATARNSTAIAKLSQSVDELRGISEKIATAQQNGGNSSQPGVAADSHTGGSTVQKLGTLSTTLKNIQGITQSNDAVLKSVDKNNAILKEQLRTLRAPL